MKRNFKILSALVMAFLLLATFVSCASETGNYYPDYGGGYVEDAGTSTDKLPGNSTGDVILEDRKIIKTVNESIHTDKYDEFFENLRNAIAEAGGYISSSSFYGAGYYNADELRDARLVIRIPAENLEKFTSTVDSLGIVYSYNESMSDVTAAYVDVESRIAVLSAEETALLEMLSLAENISDAIQIRSRLNEVQSDLASLEAQKKTYDSLISYSTVNMSIVEVRRAESKNPGFFEEVAGTFSDSLTDIGEGLRNFAVWFLGNIIYIVIFAAFVTGGVFLFIKLKRVKKAKKEQREKEDKSEE